MSTDSTSFEVEDSSSSFEWPFDVTIILEPLTPETPAIVDGADGIPQPSPLQSAVPGQPMPLNLPPPTAAPNSNQPDGVEIPSANASSAAPAPTGISGGNVNDCPHCCTIYFDYVNVYYWPVASSNTECLSIVSSETLPPTPPGFTMYFSVLTPSWKVLLTVFLGSRQVFMSCSPQSVPATRAL